jgi:hypothetical protein
MSSDIATRSAQHIKTEQNEAYLSNSWLISPSSDSYTNSLVHPPRPHHNANNILVLLALQRRIPLATVQVRWVHMLQHLRPDGVRQNPLHQAVRFRERVIALGKRKGGVVPFHRLGRNI